MEPNRITARRVWLRVLFSAGCVGEVWDESVEGERESERKRARVGCCLVVLNEVGGCDDCDEVCDGESIGVENLDES